MARRNDRKSNGNGTPALVGYVRVSTEEQAREGVSLEAQRERLAAYCIAHGFKLAALETDEGVSGKVSPTQRPGLARALERVRTGEVCGLVTVKLDRLSRSVRDTLDLADSAQREDWRLVSLSEHLDTGSAAGRFTLTVLAALAQLEREQVSERTRETLAYIAREGRGRSRFTPYGFRTAGGGVENRAGDRSALVPHTEEQAALRRLVALRESGLGARRIAAQLGEPNPRSGQPWTADSVASILRRLERWERAGAAPLAM